MDIRGTLSHVMGGDGEAPSALDIIKNDHHEVDELFVRALDEGADEDERQEAIEQICEALTLHAEMEEALFYPELREEGEGDNDDDVLEAGEEHAVVKDLIARIEETDPGDETMKAKVTVLKELVHHHVEEEESTLFAEARESIGEERLREIGAEMVRFKEQGGRSRRGGRGGRGAKKSSTRKSSSRKSTTRKASSRTSSAKKPAGKRGSTKKSAGKTSSTRAKADGAKKKKAAKRGGRR